MPISTGIQGFNLIGKLSENENKQTQFKTESLKILFSPH
jgi:hypothetical protein